MAEGTRAGRVDGMHEMAWQLFADRFPPAPPRRSRGMPPTPFRQVVHTVLDGLLTGCRWGELPRGPPGASTSAAPRWRQRWPVDGTLGVMHVRLLGSAAAPGQLPWQDGAVEGACAPWHRRQCGRGLGPPRSRPPQPPSHRGGRQAAAGRGPPPNRQAWTPSEAAPGHRRRSRG